MDGDIRPLEPADPREVGGHTLLGRLGSGGMGTVYLGTDPVSGGRVAVKTIHPHLAGDPSYRRRFLDEADLAGRVASFCTARVLTHGEEDGRPYLVTEYVGGISLHDRLADDGPLPAADLHGVAVGVASALAAIHAAGLVHRDLKPANVMLTLSGCRVIDFGIARSQDSISVTAATGQVLGTPGWMAPEVLIGGPATPAADVFAWGCLIAHAGTGRMPIGGDPATLRTAADAPDLSGLPGSLVPSVRSALARNPTDRPTASDLLLALVEQPPA
ncbi:MAG: serine/threonine-protein kinase, partial [Spirillospora sp.]